VSNSITVHPRDQMSDLGEAPFNSMTSGAIQFGVPATSFISRSIARKFKETPKSDSLTLPFLVVRMLAALRSQWTTSLMEVMQTLKDLDHVTGYQALIQLPESFQGLT
jgi:hypothetical protein